MFTYLKQALRLCPPISTYLTLWKLDRLRSWTTNLDQDVRRLGGGIEALSHGIEGITHGIEGITHGVEGITHGVEGVAHHFDAVRDALGARLDSLQVMLHQQRALLIDTNLSLGRMHARAGAPYEAMDCYHHVLSLDPSLHTARRYLAEVFVQVGDMRQALNFLGTALGLEVVPVNAALTDPAELSEVTKQHIKPALDHRSAITIGTSLMPRRIAQQKVAIRSWKQLDFDVVSVNNATEIEQLRPYFPDVRFHEARHTAEELCGRPVVPIAEIVAALMEGEHDIVGILNSDLVLEETDAFADGIRTQVPESLVFGNRIDVDRAGSTEGQIYAGGYDFFFFEKSKAGKFSSPAMVMGMPWWDFWMPLAAHLSGLRLTKLTQARALHYVHPVGYSFELFLKLAEQFIASLGTIANGHVPTIQSELAGLTRNIFLSIDAQGQRPGQIWPAHAIGILCSFSNFLIDHLATPVPVARSAAPKTASLQISEPAML